MARRNHKNKGTAIEKIRADVEGTKVGVARSQDRQNKDIPYNGRKGCKRGKKILWSGRNRDWGKLLKWLIMEVSLEAKGLWKLEEDGRASRRKEHCMESCGDLKMHRMYRAQKVFGKS